MLGHVVARVFVDEGYDVSVSDARFDGDLAGPLLRDVRRAACEIVINCIGTTPKQADAPTLILVNGVLPQVLAAPGQLVIHASTDGVFSGRRGGYRVEDAPDAEDPYGVSKRLGELCVALGPAVVFRSSIVGPESAPRSLLSWYLSRENAVQGYVDHVWNGVTSLAWARCALRAARGELASGVHHLTCAEPVSKARLLAAFREAFEGGPEVVPVRSTSPVNRTLVPTLALASIEEQLAELRAWYRP